MSVASGVSNCYKIGRRMRHHLLDGDGTAARLPTAEHIMNSGSLKLTKKVCWGVSPSICIEPTSKTRVLPGTELLNSKRTQEFKADAGRYRHNCTDCGPCPGWASVPSLGVIRTINAATKLERGSDDLTTMSSAVFELGDLRLVQGGQTEAWGIQHHRILSQTRATAPHTRSWVRGRPGHGRGDLLPRHRHTLRNGSAALSFKALKEKDPSGKEASQVAATGCPQTAAGLHHDVHELESGGTAPERPAPPPLKRHRPLAPLLGPALQTADRSCCHPAGVGLAAGFLGTTFQFNRWASAPALDPSTLHQCACGARASQRPAPLRLAPRTSSSRQEFPVCVALYDAAACCGHFEWFMIHCP
eukprot:3932491-Rhodomonas_salina.1